MGLFEEGPIRIRRSRFVQEFMSRLDELESEEDSFHPWKDESPDDAVAGAAEARKERLARHLSGKAVRFIGIGEAPGMNGARISGLAFTSEHLLVTGAIPRVGQCSRLSTRKSPWKEPSASILWSLLYRKGIAEETLLWNCAPLHPYERGKPMSNRTPRDNEIENGKQLIECLREHHPKAQFLAIGKKSAGSLNALGIEYVELRHPAHGGKTALERGIMAL